MDALQENMSLKPSTPTIMVSEPSNTGHQNATSQMRRIDTTVEDDRDKITKLHLQRMIMYQTTSPIGKMLKASNDRIIIVSGLYSEDAV